MKTVYRIQRGRKKEFLSLRLFGFLRSSATQNEEVNGREENVREKARRVPRGDLVLGAKTPALLVISPGGAVWGNVGISNFGRSACCAMRLCASRNFGMPAPCTRSSRKGRHHHNFGFSPPWTLPQCVLSPEVCGLFLPLASHRALSAFASAASTPPPCGGPCI